MLLGRTEQDIGEDNGEEDTEDKQDNISVQDAEDDIIEEDTESGKWLPSRFQYFAPNPPPLTQKNIFGEK